MHISQHDADASERASLAVEAMAWRIANPIMCALIGLISGGVTAGVIGLGLGVALVTAPSGWPHIVRTWARAWSPITQHLPVLRDLVLSYLPAPVVRMLVGDGRRR